MVVVELSSVKINVLLCGVEFSSVFLLRILLFSWFARESSAVSLNWDEKDKRGLQETMHINIFLNLVHFTKPPYYVKQAFVLPSNCTACDVKRYIKLRRFTCSCSRSSSSTKKANLAAFVSCLPVLRSVSYCALMSNPGKSTLWQVLRGALAKIGRTVKLHTMNPKAMPRTQLLGKIDLDTREWSDGVLTNSARDVVREPLVRIGSLCNPLEIYIKCRLSDLQRRIRLEQSQSVVHSANLS